MTLSSDNVKSNQFQQLPTNAKRLQVSVNRIVTSVKSNRCQKRQVSTDGKCKKLQMSIVNKLVTNIKNGQCQKLKSKKCQNLQMSTVNSELVNSGLLQERQLSKASIVNSYR